MSASYRAELLRRLPFEPAAIAVMGKWEPFLPARRCLEEVRARAAAALAIAEALEPNGPGPYLLSAEARLRGHPRPGCELAAEILCELGARPERIRISPAANRTTQEIHSLERMRRELGLSSVLCITAGYHAARASWLLRRERLAGERMQVLSCEDELVQAALATLRPGRRQELQNHLARGHREDSLLSVGGLNERLARVGARLPFVEKLLADWVRGRVELEDPPILTPIPRRIAP